MADEKGPASAGKFKPARNATHSVAGGYDSASPRAEEEILSFWKENKIFEKSLAARKDGQTFVFFEGPPTANNAPHIGHFETRVFKDVILRYKTMRGFHVPRRAGWDTHGLPVEVEVEKSLGLKSKKEIEAYGIAAFNKKCKESVWEYKAAWEKMTERMGFWIDLQNPYITYENSYIESLWAIVQKFAEKKLLYEDYKVMPWCARCGTALSYHELAQGYETIRENSIYVKFPLKQEKNTKQLSSFLVWTTTPWTLPGNVALAVNPEVEYLTVELEDAPNEWLILAEARLGVLSGKYKIINREKGKDLVGTEYESLYRGEPGKVVAGDFVSVEDGTGLVHIAPAFGDEDFKVSKEYNLPILITADENGSVKTEGKSWDGMFFKKADPLIVQDLKARGLLFKEEPYEHDYPFCWRCKTPLMYFARKSWWVDVNKVRKNLIENNKTINWLPEYIKEGRFGEWLKEEKNWAFSRERYWGTPLPVWRCEKCSEVKIIGSLPELDALDPQPTELIVMRHGETPMNVNQSIYWLSPVDDKEINLTKKGRRDVLGQIKKLKNEKIEVIVSSPSNRAKETAGLIARELGISEIHTVQEFYDFLVSPAFAGRPEAEFYQQFSGWEERFWKKPEGSENWRELRVRVMAGVKRLREKYQSKKILLVGHGDPLWVMLAALEGLTEKDYKKISYPQTGTFRKIQLHNWPYNSEGELDLHKPYVDEIKLRCKCGGMMRRVPEVIDVWFDSGAMPFASAHWPFALAKNQKSKIKNQNLDFPGDYIVEAIDQTRGWFYSLLAVSTLLGEKAPYKNVLVLGHVLDKNGKKMSKSLGNVVEPMGLIEKYGADASRWYFFTINQPWDSKLFRAGDIQDAMRRFLMILWNSYLYWKTYSNSNYKLKTKNYKLIINKWLLAKWNEVLKEVAKKLEEYNIVGAARLLENFAVEDISHWYIRRIRGEMKSPRSQKAKECSEALGSVLLELSKTLAPFAPFIAEGVYKGIGGEKESVHLEDFPNYQLSTINYKLLEDMEKAREIVSRALEARQKAGIKIRQPLASLQIKNQKSKIKEELLELIKGEANVKKITFGDDFELDTKITQELKEEGLVREFIRQVQDFRKELKLKPREKVELFVKAEKALEGVLKKYGALIKKEISLSELKFDKSKDAPEKEILIDDKKLTIGIVHIHHLKVKNEF